MKQSSYIRFLNYFDALVDRADIKNLDSIESALLNEVMQRTSLGQEVLVGDLLRLSSIGSQATLHGRVKGLVASGYLKQLTDSIDGRRKKLIPTKLTLNRYERLSKILAKAVNT
jgi:hypothetical protein